MKQNTKVSQSVKGLFYWPAKNDKINSAKYYFCQNIFERQRNETRAEDHVSYKVTKHSTKRGKSFTDAEFVKSCILPTVEEFCPEKVELLQDISHSVNIMM
jgi:hypothetical protein